VFPCAALQLLGYASAAQRAAGVSRLVPHGDKNGQALERLFLLQSEGENVADCYVAVTSYVIQIAVLMLQVKVELS
jgi:hypothetical protein